MVMLNQYLPTAVSRIPLQPSESDRDCWCRPLAAPHLTKFALLRFPNQAATQKSRQGLVSGYRLSCITYPLFYLCPSEESVVAKIFSGLLAKVVFPAPFGPPNTITVLPIFTEHHRSLIRVNQRHLNQETPPFDPFARFGVSRTIIQICYHKLYVSKTLNP